MSSLASHLVEGSQRHPEAAAFVRNFRSRRLLLARRQFDMVNTEVFQSQVRPRAGREGLKGCHLQAVDGGGGFS